MRLIDADVLLNAIELCTQDRSCPIHISAEIEQYITEAPAIDPVHAAGGCYCRECRYSDIVETQCGAKYFECQHFDSYVEADDFCSYGRRREDADG